MTTKPVEMTQVLSLTTRKGVGSLRWQKPQWINFLPPCNHACPAGENIQEWLRLVKAKDDLGAWRELTDDEVALLEIEQFDGDFGTLDGIANETK